MRIQLNIVREPPIKWIVILDIISEYWTKIECLHEKHIRTRVAFTECMLPVFLEVTFCVDCLTTPRQTPGERDSVHWLAHWPLTAHSCCHFSGSLRSAEQEPGGNDSEISQILSPSQRHKESLRSFVNSRPITVRVGWTIKYNTRCTPKLS